MSEIDVSDFCLVCYYDKETNKLTRIENYTNNSSDIEADIKSYEYGYNAVVIKPEQLMAQLQQLKQCIDEIEHILEVNKQELDECLRNDIDGQILSKIKEVKK